MLKAAAFRGSFLRFPHFKFQFIALTSLPYEDKGEAHPNK